MKMTFKGSYQKSRTVYNVKILCLIFQSEKRIQIKKISRSYNMGDPIIVYLFRSMVVYEAEVISLSKTCKQINKTLHKGYNFAMFLLFIMMLTLSYY